MSARLMFEVPLQTGRGQNNREHWRVANKRKKAEAEAVRLAVAGCVMYAGERVRLVDVLRAMGRKPVEVTLVRVAPSSGLDDDNLRGALKGVRDAVALALGRDDDRESATLAWNYRQERGAWGVVVEVSARAKVLPWPSWTAEEWREAAQCLRIVAHERWSLCPDNAKRCAQQANDAEAMAVALEKP